MEGFLPPQIQRDSLSTYNKPGLRVGGREQKPAGVAQLNRGPIESDMEPRVKNGYSLHNTQQKAKPSGWPLQKRLEKGQFTFNNRKVTTGVSLPE